LVDFYDIKGESSRMSVKQSTAVSPISFKQNYTDYIIGKVDGQHIVIITQYVKKI